MSRAKVDLPEQMPFSTELTVRVGDINYGQHLGNDSVLGFAHEARVRFLRGYGFSERDAGGSALIMHDAVVVYKSQALMGDVLVAEVGVGGIGPCGFDLYCRLSNRKTRAEVARVKTGMAFFDFASGRVCRTPEAFRKAVSG